MLTAAVFTVLFALASTLPQSSKDEKLTGSDLACKLEPHASVEYKCTVNGEVQQCDNTVPDGGVVTPTCKLPHYHSPDVLNYMRCSTGKWNYIARCEPECGRVVPEGVSLIVNGSRVTHGETPWHAIIYSKTFRPYMQICSGSLVTAKAVLSAAHCFMGGDYNKRPANEYAVALGKVYRPWSDSHDEHAHFSDVREIHIPKIYRGIETNFQADISVVILEKEVVFQNYIRPVCISFDVAFETHQLRAQNLGKVATWYDALTGKQSPALQLVQLPFVPYPQCLAETSDDFKPFLSDDKFCAGYLNGTAPCRGDGGSGFATPEEEKGVQRYYLRGITSTSPLDDGRCLGRTLFTRINYHEHFLKELLVF